MTRSSAWGDLYGQKSRKPRCKHCGRRVHYLGGFWWHRWSLLKSDYYCFKDADLTATPGDPYV